MKTFVNLSPSHECYNPTQTAHLHAFGTALVIVKPTWSVHLQAGSKSVRHEVVEVPLDHTVADIAAAVATSGTERLCAGDAYTVDIHRFHDLTMETGTRKGRRQTLRHSCLAPGDF